MLTQTVATPLIILSDLHLSHESSVATAHALAELVAARPGHELVLNGDVFGLSHDAKERDPVESVCTLLRRSPLLVAALRAHLASGYPLTFLAGNHDAAVAEGAMRDGLVALLDVQPGAPLTLEPWFIRRGGVHIEHGHLWDPDNAPSHPLAPWSPTTEPLGIQLTRRFVAKHGVWEFAHAHETTLVAGMERAFRLFGARTPALIARYFAISGLICAETLGERGLGRERSLGERALEPQAERTGVAASALRQLISSAPPPTHLTFQSTFLRLYFDRVVSVLGVGVGGAATLLRANPLAALLALASASYLWSNVKQSGSRYQNQPIARLRDGAQLVRRATGAELVVFGHTHVPEAADGYRNAGSFGYPAQSSQRPYLAIHTDGSPHAHHFASSARS